MRSERAGGASGVSSRAARARAERLWRETVAGPCAPSDDNDSSNVPHLTPALSSPRGGEAEQAGAACVPSPPLGAERDRERWGKIRSSDPSRGHNGAPTEPPLPAGPATRKLRALWIGAFHLGLARVSSDAALVAWIRRQRGLGAEACLSADGIARAIPPLEAWLAGAAGVDWRPHLSLGRNGRVRECRRPRARVLEAQWRILYRQGRVRIASLAALGAYAARHAGLGRADSHLALSDAQADALIRHFGKCIRQSRESRESGRAETRDAARSPREGQINRRRAQALGRAGQTAATHITETTH